MFEDAETVEMAGRAVSYLASDPNIIQKTGRILLTVDLAREYGFTDVDGKVHADMRSLKKILNGTGYTTTAMFVPEFVRIPLWVIHYAAYKF